MTLREIVDIVTGSAAALEAAGFDPSRFRLLVTPKILAKLRQDRHGVAFRPRDGGDGWFPAQVGVCCGYCTFVRNEIEGVGAQMQAIERGKPLDYNLQTIDKWCQPMYNKNMETA